MPTYEYHCDNCGHGFEKFQSMTEARLKKCPKCSKKIRRLMGTGAGIIFKGTGFYQTDYKNTRSAGSEGEKSKSSAKSGSDSKSKSESGSK